MYWLSGAQRLPCYRALPMGTVSQEWLVLQTYRPAFTTVLCE